MIVGLGYQKGSGKDTLADLMVKHLGYKKISFADPLKRGLMEMLGLSHEQVYGSQKEVVDHYWGRSPREMLQFVGTDLMRRQFDASVWVRSTLRAIEREPQTNWVVPDCRFPNEGLAISAMGGILVKVERPALVTNHLSKHDSETQGRLIDWDYVINNIEGDPDGMLVQFNYIVEGHGEEQGGKD